jgi:glycosyltransferase involved in cell wall biosynthesis
MTSTFTSVIIPSYNRSIFLFNTLKTIEDQILDKNCFEVIVIDDGSTDETEQICHNQYNFKLRYKFQSNQGDAAARNTGAQLARGDFLVFLDDDIRIEPGYLSGLVDSFLKGSRLIVMGKCITYIFPSRSVFQNVMSQTIDERKPSNTPEFDQLCSNNMGVGKHDYFTIGGMQNLGFHGSDIWCDVDFAYRAFQKGYQFRLNPEAVCFHLDHNLESRQNYIRRSEEMASRAVFLFKKYPGLQPHLRMFNDMTPLSISGDPFFLNLRKLVRRLSASRPILFSLQIFADFFERLYPSPIILKPLYRWINGAYIYLGYRTGITSIKQVE